MKKKNINKKSTQKPVLSASNSDSITQVEKDIQLETLYQCMLPQLGNSFSELAAAHILLVLKLEGIIGKEIKSEDIEMIKSIKEKVFKDKAMHKEMVRVISLLKERK